MQIRDLIPWGSNKGSEIAKSDEGNPVFSLQRDVNRIFEDFWKRLDQPFGAFGRWDTGGPRMDVTETESAIEVSVELPGIDQKDVDVSLTNSAPVATTVAMNTIRVMNWWSSTTCSPRL